MASYKLTYLNYRGRAELIRFILSQAGLQFEDCRLPPEKWLERRPSMSKAVHAVSAYIIMHAQYLHEIRYLMLYIAGVVVCPSRTHG